MEIFTEKKKLPAIRFLFVNNSHYTEMFDTEAQRDAQFTQYTNNWNHDSMWVIKTHAYLAKHVVCFFKVEEYEND